MVPSDQDLKDSQLASLEELGPEITRLIHSAAGGPVFVSVNRCVCSEYARSRNKITNHVILICVKVATHQGFCSELVSCLPQRVFRSDRAAVFSFLQSFKDILARFSGQVFNHREGF